MSRRKKSSSSRRGNVAPAASEPNRVSPDARRRSPDLAETDSCAGSGDPRTAAAPEPNPPRPNKVFLVASGLLLAAWIAFLIVLAVRASA